jgi:hypothetical protein
MRYSISNYGRIVSFKETFNDGNVLKGGNVQGYKTFHYKIQSNGKIKNYYVFIGKLVAENFLTKTSDEQTYVLHLDYARDNDKWTNLQWATRPEMLAHAQKSPHVIAAKKIPRLGIGKLTSTQVIHLKKRLLDPNRKTRVKMLAKQFGVSEMQIHRIKSGENWGHIKV